MQHKILSAIQLRRSGKESTTFELYNIVEDISEEKDLASKETAIVEKIIAIMDKAYIYDEDYPRIIKPEFKN